MKSARSFTRFNPFLSHLFRTLFIGIGVFALTAFALAAESDAPASNVRTQDPDSPASLQKSVQIMVELSEAPAATLYAKSLNEARAKADSARNYALAHPKDPGSQAVLASKSKVVISPDAEKQAENHAKQLDQVQQGMLPSLTSGKINGRVIYRVQHAYNGIAMEVNPSAVSEIAKLPGVKGVHFLHPKYLSTTFQDIDFLKAR